jgi:competence ComEA-like helix-hairpin-helix protein
MWKDFFSLSKTEQKATLALLILLILSMSVLVFVSVGSMNKVEIVVHKNTQNTLVRNEPLSKHSRFPFNPNEVSIKELEEMGFSSRNILNWKKYLEAGGRFKSADGLLSIYGIDSLLVGQVAQYVTIGEYKPNGFTYTRSNKYVKPIYLNANSLSRLDLLDHLNEALVDSIERLRQDFWYSRSFTVKELSTCHIDSAMAILSMAASPKNKRVKSVDMIIELNSADTTELDLLKGIGPAYARRIVFYRQRLGGFFRLEQLLEVEGISHELFNGIKGNLKLDPSLVCPLDVNKSSLRTLKDHPYIGFYKAKDLIEYRKNGGSFTALEQVWALKAFKDADRDLLAYYLSVK